MDSVLSKFSDNHSGLLDFTRKILNEQKIKSFLISGQILTKVTRRKGKREIRQLFLSPDLKRLNYVPPYSQRKLRTFGISEIQNIVSGKANFLKGNLDEDEKCFSIIVGNRSYDFITSDHSSRDMWVEGLQFARTGSFDVKENEEMLQEQSKIDREREEQAHKQRVETLENQLKEAEKVIEDLNSQIAKNVQIEQIHLEEIESLNRQLKVSQEIIEKLKSDNDKMLDQLHLLDKNVLNDKIQAFEDKYQASEQSYLELNAEYSEFKKQIKEIFNLAVQEKIESSHDSLELLSNYIRSLKSRTEYLEKELSIWQAYAYTYTLHIYSSSRPQGKTNLMKVLKFCLRRLEEDHETVSDANRLYSIISESLYKMHKK